MKKKILILLTVLMTVFAVSFFVACGGGSDSKQSVPESLRIEAPETVFVGFNNYSEIKVITIMSNGVEEEYVMSSSDFTVEDMQKFETVGEHEFTVQRNGLTKTFIINVVAAHDGTDGLRFEIVGDSAKVIGYSGTEETDVIIPSTFQNLPVTQIGNNVFGSYVTKLTIPEGVTTIGTEAFINATNLEEIVIPASLTTFGSKAFYAHSFENSKLTKIDYKGTLEQWCAISFSDSSATPTYRCASLFINGEEVTEIDLPSTVSSVGNFAFYNYRALKSLKATANTEFYNECFFGCTNIQELTATARQIVNVDKSGVKNLFVVKAKDGEANAQKTLINFANKNNLISVVVEDGIIGQSCFIGCANLKTVRLNDGVEEICDESFYSCRSLEEIYLGKGITKIGNSAFSESYNLKKVVISDLASWCNVDMSSEGSTPFSTYVTNGIYNHPDLFVVTNNDGEEVLEKVRTLEIPASVTEIKPYVFARCATFFSVKFNEGLTKIGEYAFYNCDGLVQVDISSTVEEIANMAFYSCERIYEVLNRSNSIEIDDAEYENGAIGKTASIIENNFWVETALKNDSHGKYIYSVDNTRRTLVACYSDQEEDIYIDGFVHNICDYAFFNVKKADSLIINIVSEMEIGMNAFQDCNFNSVYCELGNNSTKTEILNAWAAIEFENQYSNPLHNGADFYIDNNLLTKIEKGDITRTSISDYAFYGWQGTEVALSDSVNSIEKFAFSHCPYLMTFDIGNGVGTIKEGAMSYCPRLTTLVFGTNASDNIDEYMLENSCAISEIYNLSSNFDIDSWIEDLKYLEHFGRGEFNVQVIHATVDAESIVTIDENGYVLSTFGDETWLKAYVGDSTEIIVPDGVTHIAGYIFEGNREITKLVIPDSVKYVGTNAFNGCTGIEELILGNGIERIKYGALSYLKSSLYTIEGGVKYLGNYAIELTFDLYYLEDATLVIKDGTKVIADRACGLVGNYHYGIEEIVLPEGLVAIGDEAFVCYDSGYALKRINIPSSVKYVGNLAFYGANLEQIPSLGPDVFVGENAFGDVD